MGRSRSSKRVWFLAGHKVDQLPTGDTLSTNLVRYRFYIPDELWLKNAFYGEVLDAIANIAWVQEGTITVEEASYAMLQIWESIVPDWLQIGVIIPYAGSTPPDETLLPCDGRSLLRADYAELFGVIGTTYGAADATHFNIPDLMGRTVIGSGSGSGLTPRSNGDSGGEETHLLTSGEMPAHSHSDVGHAHTTGNSFTGLALAPGEEPVLIPNPIPAWTGSASANLSIRAAAARITICNRSFALTYLIVAK